MNNFAKKKKLYAIYAAIGVIPVIYLSVLLAAGLEETDNLFRAIGYISENPTDLRLLDSTPKVIGCCLLIYFFAVVYFFIEMKKYRNREEHGSSQLGDTGKINRKYTRHFKKEECKILTQNVHMGTDDRKHRRNLNALVVGGSGAMKTKGVVQPNILQGNTSYVILDPKGENLRDAGNFLIKKGYRICVLNLKN